MFSAIVCDERDVNSKEPMSLIGIYQTRKEAEIAIAEYLLTENGQFITDSFVEELDNGR